MSPTLQHFETFLAVAEMGSFTAAAKQLGVTKASVSQTIRLLESSLQLPLFIRSTRRVSLTDEGQLLLAQCQRLKNELDIARELVRGFNTSPTGKLRISCNPYFAETRLIDILREYLALFPEVQIEVISEERMPDMQHEQIDIVFGVNWPAPEDIVAKHIGTTRYVLCAAPDYLHQHGMPEDIKALEQHHYIPHLGRTRENIIADLKQPQSLDMTPQLRLNNAHFMKKCAIAGLGIVQLHDYMVEEELENGSLVALLPEYLNKKIPLYIYYQKHRFVQPKIRQFVKLCHDEST